MNPAPRERSTRMASQHERHRASSAGGRRPMRASSAHRTSSIGCQGRIAQEHACRGRGGEDILTGGASSQMGWNSKPLRNTIGLEIQATTNIKWVGFQAMAKCKWPRTPSHDKIQIEQYSKTLRRARGREGERERYLEVQLLRWRL